MEIKAHSTTLHLKMQGRAQPQKVQWFSPPWVRGWSKWFQFPSLELLLRILSSRGEGGHKYPMDPVLPCAPLAILGAVQGWFLKSPNCPGSAHFVSTRKPNTELHDPRQQGGGGDTWLQACQDVIVTMTQRSMWQWAFWCSTEMESPEILSERPGTAHHTSSSCQSRSGGPDGQCTKHEPSLCPGDNEGHSILGCISRSLTRRERQMITVFVRAHVEYCVYFWAPSTRKMPINCSQLSRGPPHGQMAGALVLWGKEENELAQPGEEKAWIKAFQSLQEARIFTEGQKNETQWS